MFRYTLIAVVLASANAGHAFADSSLWSISAGNDRVVEFLSEERLYCGNYCYSFSVAGRPDEIFVSPFRGRTLSALRQGNAQKSHPYDVYVVNLKTNTVHLIELDDFLELDIVFEDFPVRGYEAYPEVKYRGNPAGHIYVAPIQRAGEEFVAALSSERRTSEKTTFGSPSIIPFMGRQEWVQTEPSYSGTFLLEIFDTSHPSKPVVQLRKDFKDLRLLPPVHEMASWTQGAEKPILVVVDNESVSRKGKGRILVIRP